MDEWKGCQCSMCIIGATFWRALRTNMVTVRSWPKDSEICSPLSTKLHESDRIATWCVASCQSHGIVFSPHSARISPRLAVVHPSPGSVPASEAAVRPALATAIIFPEPCYVIITSYQIQSNSYQCYHHVRIQSSTVPGFRTTGGSYM